MAEQMGASDCVFCWLPQVLQATGPVAIFEPLNPVTEGHVLVVPRRHVADASESPDLTGEVMRVAAQHARALPAANIITSIGADATQTVFHLHVHVVPRLPGDGLPLPWTPQQEAAKHWPLAAGDCAAGDERMCVECGESWPCPASLGGRGSR